MTDQRPVRICDVCGGFDSDPRHVIAYVPGTAPEPDPEVFKLLAPNPDLTSDEGAKAVQDFFDTSVQYRHMDCCRTAGCPDGSCLIVTAGAEDLRGDALLAHLEAQPGLNLIDGRPADEVIAEIEAAQAAEQNVEA